MTTALGRLRSLLAVLLLVSAASFFLTDLLRGSAAVAILGPGATPQAVEQVERDLHLDRPAPERYARWLGDVARGDLGRSYRTNEPVRTLVGRTLSVTFELIVLAQIVALTLGVLCGTWAAHRVDTRADRVLSAVTFAAIAVPQFAVAVVLLLIFSVHLQWFPAVGFVPFFDSPIENLRAMVLPAATLGVPLAGQYARVLRADMIVVLQQDHVRLARAMGLPSRRILWRHAVRQSSLTLLTMAGLQLGVLLGGSLIVESIFALPGMGRLMIERVTSRDHPVVQACVLVIASGYVIANFAVDRLQTMMDPRVRLSNQSNQSNQSNRSNRPSRNAS